MPDSILIVDDEREIADLVDLYLKNEGYTLYKCYDGAQALEQIAARPIDLAILDVMLPEMDGFQLCQKIREQHHYPIIMLTAKVEEIDKINGLALGADDYITKPFSLRELKARIKAVLRRTKSGSVKGSGEEVLTFGTLEIDMGRREVKQQGKIVELTPSEYAILITLCQNIGRPYSRLQLLNATLGESYAGYERAIDTHVSNLRKKIEPNPQKPVYILTVYGLGYKFGDHYETNQ